MNDIEFYGTYDKWRKMIMHTNRYLTLIIFIVEIIMYFILRYSGLILQSTPVYLIRFLILPTFLNLCIIVAGELIIQHTNSYKPYINYVPVIQLAFLCLIVSSTHYIFSVTLCTFCFPVFITVIFNNKKMTQRIMELCTVLLLIALLVRAFDSIRVDADEYLISEACVAYAILLSTHVFCRILIQFQCEKNEVIHKAHQYQLAMQDQLSKDQKTGLYGSNAFSNALSLSILHADKRPFPLTLAIMDIDNFKSINDTYGHAQGDKVIIKIAELMTKNCPQNATLARFGGEEFAVIFNIHSEPEVYEWLEQLRKEFSRQSFDFMDGHVTVSIGFAVWSPGWTNEQFFNYADEAMYHAKKHGKNMVIKHSLA